MQLSNGRVWDYVGDNYVHRLIQNKEDGKLVEMDERGQRASDEKMDSLTLEVLYLWYWSCLASICDVVFICDCPVHTAMLVSEVFKSIWLYIALF